MDIKERKGSPFWYAEFIVKDKHGRAKRYRLSTGIKVAAGSGARRESRRHAERAGRRLQDLEERKADGRDLEEAQPKTLEQGILAVLSRSGAVSADEKAIAIAFDLLGPDAPLHRVDSLALQQYCSQLVRVGYSSPRVSDAIDLLRSAAEALDIEPPSAPPPTFHTSVQHMINRYFEGVQIRSTTAKIYRTAADLFCRWCKRERIVTAGEITVDTLAQYSQHVKLRAKLRPKSGGRIGEFEPTDRILSSAAVSRELRAISAIVNGLRKRRLMVHLLPHEVSDALAIPTRPRKLKTFLSPLQINALLAAAAGSECGPFILFLLLSGMRPGELTHLEWSEVDTANHVIRLPPEKTKTDSPRFIDLEVSPTLIELLAMRPHTGRYVFGRNRGELPAKSYRKQFLRLPFRSPTQLRETCATYLSCMPTYGPYRSSERLGHSVAVAQRYYAGSVKVSMEAMTLEAAMGIELFRIQALIEGR